MVNLNKYAVESGLKNTFVYIRDRKLRKSRNDASTKIKMASEPHNFMRLKDPKRSLF